jgi:hypothetical protein
MAPMDADSQYWLWCVITSAFGMAYFIYGKKQMRMVPLVSGIILCVLFWFVEKMWVAYLVGGLLIVLPWFWRV